MEKHQVSRRSVFAPRECLAGKDPVNIEDLVKKRELEFSATFFDNILALASIFFFNFAMMIVFSLMVLIPQSR